MSSLPRSASMLNVMPSKKNNWSRVSRLSKMRISRMSSRRDLPVLVLYWRGCFVFGWVARNWEDDDSAGIPNFQGRGPIEKERVLVSCGLRVALFSQVPQRLAAFGGMQCSRPICNCADRLVHLDMVFRGCCSWLSMLSQCLSDGSVVRALSAARVFVAS